MAVKLGAIDLCTISRLASAFLSADRRSSSSGPRFSDFSKPQCVKYISGTSNEYRVYHFQAQEEFYLSFFHVIRRESGEHNQMEFYLLKQRQDAKSRLKARYGVSICGLGTAWERNPTRYARGLRANVSRTYFHHIKIVRANSTAGGALGAQWGLDGRSMGQRWEINKTQP